MVAADEQGGIAMNIIVIGLRGCGKSSVSRRLSVLTKCPVLSTDLLISYENGGRSVAQIVSSHQGDWRPFRDMEYAVVRKVAAMDGIIIDAGGGIVVDWDEENKEIFSERKMSALKKNGFVVWIKGDIKYLANKVRNDATRPVLSESLATEEIMWQRLPFYQQVADWAISGEGRTRKQLAWEIFRHLPKGFCLDNPSVLTPRR